MLHLGDSCSGLTQGYGGKYCKGSDFESTSCFEQDCPRSYVNGKRTTYWQTGWCNDRSGRDQDYGLKVLGAKGSTEDCLHACTKRADATGCEFHSQWGCSVHTKDVGAGSGHSPFSIPMFCVFR